MTEFRTFVAEKEQEWKNALNQQIALLEESLANREADLREERKMTSQLKEDFKYNMRLLGERDEELGNFEKENILLKQQVVALEEKVSNISVKLDEAKQRLDEETIAKSKLADHQQAELDSKERELHYLRHEHELKICRLKDEHSALRRQQEMDIAKFKKEIELQKRELLGAFDRKAEESRSEYQQRLQLAERQALDYEMQRDLLQKDNASLERARAELLQRLQGGDKLIADLQAQLAEANNRLEADAAVQLREAERHKELLSSLEIKHKAELERLSANTASLQAELDNKQQLLQADRQRLKEERSSVRQQTAALLQQLQQAEAAFLRKQTDLESRLKTKEADAEALQSQVEELQQKLANAGGEAKLQLVEKAAECDRLNAKLLSLQEELHNRRADIDRYKQQLQLAAMRDKEFETKSQQLDIDHQHRMEELEVLQYEKSETYIQKLTEAKDEALAQLELARASLQQKQAYIGVLLQDREAAVQALDKHGISIDRQLKSKASEGQQLAAVEAKLREAEAQNDALKAVVKQMRADMELLQQQQQQRQPQQQQQQQQQHSVGNREIANTLAKLRSERTDLLAQCRKQQARIQHLESALADCEADRASSETAAEQLRYQLSAQERHASTELAGVKRRQRELETQLAEAQREADEYYKANIEQSRLCEQLQQQALAKQQQQEQQRLRSAARPGEVNFGAQELYIQQLQDEIASLRQKLSAKQLYDLEEDGVDEGRKESDRVRELRAKLKLAAAQVRKLAQERQALVDVSNRLRAQLRSANSGGGGTSTRQRGGDVVEFDAASDRPGRQLQLQLPTRSAVRDAVGDISSKLQQLERMQYYITKEELSARSKKDRQQEQLELGASAELPVRDTAAAGPQAAAAEVPQHSAGPIRRAEGLGRSAQSLGLSSIGGESLQEVWQLLDESQAPLSAGRL